MAFEAPIHVVQQLLDCLMAFAVSAPSAPSAPPTSPADQLGSPTSSPARLDR